MANKAGSITWRKVRLGDVATLKMGPFGSNLPVSCFVPAGVPVINGSQLRGSRLGDGPFNYITEEKAQELRGANAFLGDIVVTHRGTLGQASIISKDAKHHKYVISQSQFLIRCNDEVLEPMFLVYLLQSPHGQYLLKANVAPAGVPSIAQPVTYTRSLEIELPPINEQKRIADILSAFDDKIELNNKISRTLEEMAQAIFKEWFVKFRFPGHEKAEFVDSELGRIPKGWEVKQLGDALKLQYGKALKAEGRNSGDVLVVGSSGIVGTHNEKLVSGPGIVVGRKGTVGSVIWVDNDFYPIDTTFYVESNFNLYFCFFLLKKQKFVTGDSAVPGLNRDIALSNWIVVPETDFIARFGELVEPIFKKLAANKSENKRLASLRDLLLPKLMSGEIQA